MDKVSQELTTVTSEMALKWLTENRYPRQRALSIYAVDLLAEHMEKGTFRQGTQIAFASVRGKHKMLTNGQHTLQAVIKSGKPQLLSVMHHNVDTMEQVNWLYVQEDRHRRRTVADTFNAFDMLDQMELRTKRQLNSVGSSVRVIMSGFNRCRARIRDEDFLAAMSEYKEAARLYFASINGTENALISPLYRYTTLPIGLVTCRYAVKSVGEEYVTDFWSGVALDDGLKKGDPRKSLLFHFRNDALGTYMTSTKRRVPIRWAIYRVADCWNNWVANEKMDLDPSVSLNRPIHIAGTPYVAPSI